MASFLDKVSPTNFNPYVQQISPEQIAKIGTYKQEKYNEGVQKIQSYIDNVAGLPVARPIDKQYLQGKLNELGSKLKTVAAGDFSNFQLVNSVGGMANQIIKDPTIQNAISSAQYIQKGQEELDTARKEGKSAPQNEDWWNSQVNEFMNSQDLKQRFTAQYVPYTDLTEKYAKIAKDVEGSEYSYDQPYITDSAGNLRYFTKDSKGNTIETTKDKGSPMLDDAMKRITTKGKSAQTILNTFYDSMSESDKRQFQIDASYHYKGANADVFKNDIVSTFNLKKEQLEKYATELKANINSPKISDKDKATLQARLTDVNRQLTSGELDQRRDDLLRELNNPSDLLGYKTKLYMQKWLTNLAQDKSTESYKEEIVNNPYAQLNMQKKRLEFDVQKENTRINEFNYTARVNAQKWIEEKTIQLRKLQLEEEKAEEERLEKAPIVTSGPKGTDVVKPTVLTINAKINANNDLLKSTDADFLSKHPEYTKADLDKFSDEYSRDSESLNLHDNALRNYIIKRREIEHDNIRNGNLLKGAEEATSNIDKQINSALKAEPGITDISGREVISSNDMFEVKKDLDNFSHWYKYLKPEGFGIQSIDTDEFLKKYRGTNKEVIANALVKKYLGKPLSSIEHEIVNKSSKLSDRYSSDVDKLIQQKLDKQSEYLADKIPNYFTWRGRLKEENKRDMSAVNDIIAAALNPPLGSEDIVSKDQLSPKTLAAWKADPKIEKSLYYTVVKNYDGSGELIVQKGTDQQSIPLSPEKFRRYFPKYAPMSDVDRINSEIISSPASTTNINKRNDPVNAGYTGYSLPLLKDTNYANKVRFDIEGDKADPSDKTINQYQIRLYVFDGKVWHNDVINQRGYYTQDQIMQAINNIGLDVVEKVLKN